jgi:hypothetical protein
MIGHIKMFDRYLADCVNIKKKCKRKWPRLDSRKLDNKIVQFFGVRLGSFLGFEGFRVVVVFISYTILIIFKDQKLFLFVCLSFKWSACRCNSNRNEKKFRFDDPTKCGSFPLLFTKNCIFCTLNSLAPMSILFRKVGESIGSADLILPQAKKAASQSSTGEIRRWE